MTTLTQAHADMIVAEAEFDAACAALKQVRADRKRSKGRKTLEALQQAEDSYDICLASFKRLTRIHSKALAASVADLKARADAAGRPKTMDLFA